MNLLTVMHQETFAEEDHHQWLVTLLLFRSHPDVDRQVGNEKENRPFSKFLILHRQSASVTIFHGILKTTLDSTHTERIVIPCVIDEPQCMY